MLNCLICGSELSGRQEKFCSLKCRNKFNQVKNNKLPKDRKCVVCGEPLRGIQALYCSKQCAYDFNNKKRSASKGAEREYIQLACNKCGKIFSAKSKNHRFCSSACGTEAKDKRRVEARTNKTPKTCEQCGASFVFADARKMGRYCSVECRKKASVEKGTEYDRKRRGWDIPRECRCCGKVFIKTEDNSHYLYCSDACAVSAWHDIRRACNRKRYEMVRFRAKSGKHFNPINIKRLWARDGGKCALCGKRVDINLHRGGNGTCPDKMSATVDHIIPISKGGDHAWTNVQLAHFTCNNKRGNRGIAQTLLFG